MNDLQSILDKRHLWSRIAGDLVLMSLPRTASSTTVTIEGICRTYGLSAQALELLAGRDDFIEMVKREAARAKTLGHRAGFLLRAEYIATEMVEELYRKVRSSPDAELRDVTKAAELLIKATGLGVEKEQAVAVTSTVAVQFNMPALSNSKLDHLKAPALEAGA